MKTQPKWIRIVYVIGVVALIAGILDPLEGSVVLSVGSGLIALATSLTHDRHRKIFLTSFILIVTGVFFLFFFSSLGGFPPLSWWWSPLMLPYPVGWLMAVITLIMRAVKKSPVPSA